MWMFTGAGGGAGTGGAGGAAATGLCMAPWSGVSGGSVGNMPEVLGEDGPAAVTGFSTDVNSGSARPRRSAVSASSTRALACSIVCSSGSHDSTRCSTSS
jgi:hypothetical protein